MSLPQKIGVQTDEQKIYCLRELQGLVRAFPDKMYANAAEDRPRLRAIFDQAGDKAINEEKV